MPFTFTTRLMLVCPIGKNWSINRTLDTGLDREQALDQVRFWFPVFDQIIMNVRHGKLRAYHSLPNYFLLFYQEADRAGKGQKWKNALRIRVYRDCTIEAFDYETQDTHTYT